MKTKNKMGAVAAFLTLMTVGSQATSIQYVVNNNIGVPMISGVEESVIFGGGYTNFVTAANGDRTVTGRWRLDSDHVMTAPTYSLSATGQAYTALGVATEFGGNNSIFGVDTLNLGDGRYFETNEYITVTFNQDVILKAVEITDMNGVGDEFNIDWGASSVTLTQGDKIQLYTFAADTTLTAGSVLTLTGVGTRAALTGFAVETIPEPATLGMIAAMGAGILFIRRRLMM